MSSTGESDRELFKLGQRVHSVNDTRRIGTVKYVGEVQGYSGAWVGVDWDDGNGKHDGSVNGVRYFRARSEKSGSFVRVPNLSPGVSLLEALQRRYKSQSTEEEEDEMYVFTSSNKRVSVELLGKDKLQDKLSKFEELTGASLSYLGVSSPGVQCNTTLPISNIRISLYLMSINIFLQDVGAICEQLPALATLNLSNNLMTKDVSGLPQLKNIRILVLNSTGISWMEVEILKHSLPAIEELHLMGNSISALKLMSSPIVEGFDSLRLLNLDENSIADWNEILILSQLRSLEQLYLNKNKLKRVHYPDSETVHELLGAYESQEKSYTPFQKLSCLLLGSNNIEDLASIDSLNVFPNLRDIRLSDNPIADPGRGGITRFVIIARLAKIEILNGSEISPRERKESEIRYVRLVMSTLHGNPGEIKQLHPRFDELKKLHGIEDERPSIGAGGPQKMASGLLSVTLKCVGASMGEKPPLTKKLPATTTVGKLKILCESFFKLKSITPKLFLQEEGSPLPSLLDDEMASLIDVGVGNDSTILVDEEK
ncbi:hypothetical protein JRO89_XS05G0225900 [Xanthoceras sorbifolium]|uniref:CAP-Gly domain-containing protein n=1 Tax=Xanthoceras sorbifolium TaxID=99658 RepID=A0ABQ8I2U8_9ROSI|nr:hypothetical protein JRO89_XS05G0225900 [Xanthoceras sorbifolium]